MIIPDVHDDRTLRESIYLIFLNLQDMIKFAETKNAAIVASAGTILILIFDKLSFTGFVASMFTLGYFCLIVSILTAFWAIYPIYPIYRHGPRKAVAELQAYHPNLLVFSDIAAFPSYDLFEAAIAEKYYGKQSLSPFEKDMCLSIYTSANIALRKFRLFKHALIYFILGGLLIVVFGPMR